MTNPRLAPAALLVGLMLGALSPAGAQDFTPPESSETSSRFEVGFFGFATRFGLDVGDETQTLLSVALDAGTLGMDRLRLRPSVEIGFANAVDTYVVNAEVLYRFTPDTERAVPYVGTGLGVAGRDNCGAVDGCPSVELQFVLGFELQFQRGFNWMLEYHAEDALDRHRLLVGLTTRRPS